MKIVGIIAMAIGIFGLIILAVALGYYFQYCGIHPHGMC